MIASRNTLRGVPALGSIIAGLVAAGVWVRGASEGGEKGYLTQTPCLERHLQNISCSCEEMWFGLDGSCRELHLGMLYLNIGTDGKRPGNFESYRWDRQKQATLSP